MNISIHSNCAVITGNIKSVSDSQKVKESLEPLITREHAIILDIKDSISITSSLIGYLTKLVQKDGIDVTIKVGDESLIELFDDLNLTRLFKVRKA